VNIGGTARYGSAMSSPAGVVQLGVLVVVLAVAARLLVVARRARRTRTEPLAAAGPAAEEAPDHRPFAAVVANPTKVDDRDVRLDWVSRASTDLGWDPPMWLETTPDDVGVGQTRAAVEAGAAVVLAYGGDGTVRAVGSALAGTGVPLGLLPRGTGNLLARNLGIGVADLGDALRTALSWSERKVDVGRLEIDVSGEDHAPRTESFLVMAGLGFDAEVMASVRPALKERVGWFAYVVAGARVLRGRRSKVVLRLDGADPITRRMRTVIVGNCGELTGGVRLMPDALIDDGYLDVVVVSAGGVVSWAAVTAAVLTRSRRGHPVVEHFRCREIEIRAETPQQVQLDGDPTGEARVLRARLDPLALVVRVPPLG
jgi:diacylglycerol kinase family enzyme